MRKSSKQNLKIANNANADEKYIYITIASTDENYLSYDKMKEYSSLEEARKNYQDDIIDWKKNHEEYHHFGIKEIIKN